MIIFGAMQQMMPVLAGTVVKKSKLFAAIVHTCLVLGTLFMSFSFWLAFSLFIGAVQAFIFTMLSMSYLANAMKDDDHH